MKMEVIILQNMKYGAHLNVQQWWNNNLDGM